MSKGKRTETEVAAGARLVPLVGAYSDERRRREASRGRCPKEVGEPNSHASAAGGRTAKGLSVLSASSCVSQGSH
jgi:hypothetical protein